MILTVQIVDLFSENTLFLNEFPALVLPNVTNELNVHLVHLSSSSSRPFLIIIVYVPSNEQSSLNQRNPPFPDSKFEILTSNFDLMQCTVSCFPASMNSGAGRGALKSPHPPPAHLKRRITPTQLAL